MSPAEIKKTRERLGLTQEEFALSLGLASKNVISNLETGFRNPSGIVQRVLSLLADLPQKEAKVLVEKLRKQAEKERAVRARH